MLEQVIERNHRDLEGMILKMADPVSIAAVSAIEPTLELEPKMAHGKDRSSAAIDTLACVLSTAMARRLVYALQRSGHLKETDQWYDKLTTALLGTFNSLSQERLADERFLFSQLEFDQAQEMKFGLEPYLTHALLTGLLAGKSISGFAELKAPLGDAADAVAMGFQLGSPRFAFTLLSAESRLFEAWNALNPV